MGTWGDMTIGNNRVIAVDGQWDIDDMGEVFSHLLTLPVTVEAFLCIHITHSRQQQLKPDHQTNNSHLIFNAAKSQPQRKQYLINRGDRETECALSSRTISM